MKKPFLTAFLFLLAIPFFIFPAAAADVEPEEHTLTIQYQNKDGTQAFPTYTAQMAEGEEYSVESPQLEEVFPDLEVVEGIMGDEDVSEIVTYAIYCVNYTCVSRRTDKVLNSFSWVKPDYGTKTYEAPSFPGYTSPQPTEYTCSDSRENEYITFTYYPILFNATFKFYYKGSLSKEILPRITKQFYFDDPVECDFPSIEGYEPSCYAIGKPYTAWDDTSFQVIYSPKSYNLTIKYQYEDGSQASRAYSRTLNYGQAYSIESPALQGYAPDIDVVSGTMGSGDLEIIVTYSLKVSNLVIDYLYQNGSKAAPSVTIPFEYNQPYDVPSPSVKGYKPDVLSVAGVMGDEDIHITVTYTKGDSILTIRYLYKNGVSASGTYSRSYQPGESYNIKSPSIKGYTADKAEVSGEMPPNDLAVTVIYSPIPYTLTILYQYEDGTEAALPYTSSVGYNNTFSVPSPSVPGFAPDRSVISGKMGSSDATFTVTYKEPRYLLTVKYNSQNRVSRSNGVKIAPDYTGRFKEGERYEVPSPLIMGYETELTNVSGIMPAHDVIEVVSYTLAGEPVMGDTSALRDAISSSGEYIQEYISGILLTLVTAGLVIFAAIMAVRVIIWAINYFTKS